MLHKRKHNCKAESHTLSRKAASVAVAVQFTAESVLTSETVRFIIVLCTNWQKQRYVSFNSLLLTQILLLCLLSNLSVNVQKRISESALQLFQLTYTKTITLLWQLIIIIIICLRFS